MSESIAKVQAEINNFLKVAHTFENAITKTNMEYRKERKTDHLRMCSSGSRPAVTVQEKEKSRVFNPEVLKLSLSSLLTKGRTTFAEKDATF